MVELYKPKFTRLQEEILRFLFVKVGMVFNAHGLAKNLKVSQTAVSKALKGLVKANLLDVEKDKESGRFSIELNKDNPSVFYMKRVYNLYALYESGLVDFLEDKFPGSVIILFGSYAFGEDTVDSDIDIALNICRPIFAKCFEKMANDSTFLCFTGWRYEPEFRSLLSELGFTIKGNSYTIN